jgi:hypothetical protein
MVTKVSNETISLAEQIRRARGVYINRCPICNGIVETGHNIESRGALHNYIYCPKCLLFSEKYSKESEAIESWNNRLDPKINREIRERRISRVSRNFKI